MMGQSVFMANFIQRGGKCKYEPAVHAEKYVSQLASREVLFSLVFFSIDNLHFEQGPSSL